jgi:hypothetical protein
MGVEAGQQLACVRSPGAPKSDSVGGTASGRIAVGADDVGEAWAGTADLNRIATAIHDGVHLDIAGVAALNAH